MQHAGLDQIRRSLRLEDESDGVAASFRTLVHRSVEVARLHPGHLFGAIAACAALPLISYAIAPRLGGLSVLLLIAAVIAAFSEEENPSRASVDALVYAVLTSAAALIAVTLWGEGGDPLAQAVRATAAAAFFLALGASTYWKTFALPTLKMFAGSWLTISGFAGLLAGTVALGEKTFKNAAALTTEVTFAFFLGGGCFFGALWLGGAIPKLFRR